MSKQEVKGIGESTTRMWGTPEFLLVVLMLIALVILVVAVLFAPLCIPNQNLDATKDMLDYRKNILAIIITAFGAWVGAGAAYFFGRENLREASQNLIEMHKISGKDRLSRIKVKDVPNKKIDWTVKKDVELKTVRDMLRAKVDVWFIPIIKDDGTLENIIHEEALWRFEDSQYQEGAKYDTIWSKKVDDLLNYIKSEQLHQLEGIYAIVTPDTSAADAHDEMMKQGVYLAFVLDKAGKPVYYITTADIRIALIQSD